MDDSSRKEGPGYVTIIRCTDNGADTEEYKISCSKVPADHLEKTVDTSNTDQSEAVFMNFANERFGAKAEVKKYLEGIGFTPSRADSRDWYMNNSGSASPEAIKSVAKDAVKAHNEKDPSPATG